MGTANNSIVLDLQRKATDPQTRVTTLLHLALVVAHKLDLPDLQRWINLELGGYDGAEPPEYRRLTAEVKALHPTNGWVPVTFDSNEHAAAAANAPCRNPVSELEHMVHTTQETGAIIFPFSDETKMKLMQMAETRLVPTRVIGISSIVGVLDAVRSLVLRWALDLEKKGILGDGIVFSLEEKAKAAEPNIQINNINNYGVFGNVQAQNLQIGDYSSIHEELKRCGIDQASRNELDSILDELKAANDDDRPSLLDRGIAWVGRTRGGTRQPRCQTVWVVRCHGR